MKKPEHQWETRRYLAVRATSVPPEYAHDPAAQAFELQPRAGAEAVGQAWFSLTRQQVPAAAVDDDLVFAVKCWLAARGRRVIALVDDHGRDVAQGPFTLAELGASGGPPAQRIISLCPSNAEIVGALGVFDRVVACEDSSDWPEAVAQCERLGPDLGPDLDRVAALAPDLALSSLSVPGMERIVTGLRVRGVAQLVLAPRSLADVIAEIVAVGAALGVPDAAQTVQAQLLAERDALVAARPTQRRRVYLEWWPRPMFSPGAACFSNELIDLAGGINVFAERPGASVEITADDLIAADPAVCFVSWCGVALDRLDPQNLVQRPGLAELAAVRGGHVYPLDERFSGRPGPRMLEAARIMARAICKIEAPPCAR